MLKIVRARYIWNNSQDQIETKKKAGQTRFVKKKSAKLQLKRNQWKNCNRDNGAKQQPRQSRSQATTKTKPVSNPKWDNTSIKQQLKQNLCKTTSETKPMTNWVLDILNNQKENTMEGVSTHQKDDKWGKNMNKTEKMTRQMREFEHVMTQGRKVSKQGRCVTSQWGASKPRKLVQTQRKRKPSVWTTVRKIEFQILVGFQT